MTRNIPASSLNASHPYFTIESTAQCWIMSDAQLAKGTPHPEQWNMVSEPWALPAYYFVYPAETPNGYTLVAADIHYYNYQVLEQLADKSTANVAPLLNWHLERTTDLLGFMAYLHELVDGDLLAQQGLRSFEATYHWLEQNRLVSKVEERAKKVEAEKPEKRALGHLECMLALDLLGVPDQFRGTDMNKKGPFLATLIDFDQRKTQDALRAFKEKTKFDSYVPKVIERLYTYCEKVEVLETPFGQQIAKLWQQTKAKEI